MCGSSRVMQAIDLGFRVVLATDARCSMSDGAHDTVGGLFGARFSSQVEAATTENLLRRWQ
jgi:nicotinamidase-related amidase